MAQYIGNIILLQRVKAGLTQRELSRGIASASELSRIERGETEADKVLLEALFQRLGKSMDKLEIALPDEEYRMLLLREFIRQNLFDKNKKMIKLLLEEYTAYSNCTKPLHCQYLIQMEALSSYIAKRDDEKCIARLGRALDITFPKWRKYNGGKEFLCNQEIQLFLIISYLLAETGQADEAAALEQKMLLYVNLHYTDEEEKAKVYPQCAWLLGRYFLKMEKWEQAYGICEAGKECLVQNGVLTLMEKFLEIEMICLEKLDHKSELYRLTRQMEALTFLYEICRYQRPDQDMLYLLSVSQQNELIISNELIRELRVSQNLSQEELSGDICTQETLSRIESGGRSPNRKNLQKMLGKMGMERVNYSGVVVSEDYEVYELVRKYKRLWFQKDFNAAIILLDEIEELLNLTAAANRQFVEAARLQAKIVEGKISTEEAIVGLQDILRYTMKEFDGNVPRTPFREEYIILNQIAICLKKVGRYQEAITIYEQILEKYHSSKVLEEHHAISAFLLYINYAAVLEEDNKLEKSEVIGKKGIELAVRCGRGDVAGILLANLACVYEKMNSPEAEKLCEACLRNSYHLLLLNHHEKNASVIEEYYKEKNGMNPD